MIWYRFKMNFKFVHLSETDFDLMYIFEEDSELVNFQSKFWYQANDRWLNK